MLNSWISRSEIYMLLSKSKSINNLINKYDFLQCVGKLKQHKKPTKKGHSVNNKYDIEACIKKYKNEVEYKRQKSYFEKWIEKLDESQREQLINRLTIYEKKRGYLLKIKMNIVPKEYLSDIVKVSKRTIARWEKAGIIIRRCHRITDYKTYSIYFYYYELSQITEVLKYYL